MTPTITDIINIVAASGGVAGFGYMVYQWGKGKSKFVTTVDCSILHKEIDKKITDASNVLDDKIEKEAEKRSKEDVKLHEKIDSANYHIAIVEGKISKRS